MQEVNAALEEDPLTKVAIAPFDSQVVSSNPEVLLCFLFMISHILLVQSATGLPSYDLRPIGILLGSPFPSALDKSIFWRISVQSVVNLFLHSSWTR